MGWSASVAELPSWARVLLGRARVAHLGLIDDEGAPRVLPVTFATAGGRLVTAIDYKPKRVPAQQLARVRWARARPQATITVDQYDEDWSALEWVQATGTITIVDAAAAGDALAELATRYPQYRQRPPDGPVLVLEPERLRWWRAAP